MAQHLRILMVEDSPRDAGLIEGELQRAELKFSAWRVDTESEFRDALESTDPDVILCDNSLPGFDGIAALKIARSLRPETPFIFVSGSIGEERAVQALREGAIDYILKDRLSRLASAVTRALDQRRDRQLRQRAQEALQRSEQRFQYAAKATREVIWDLDVAAGTMWFSEALETIWGQRAESGEAPRRWWEAHIHPEDRPRVVASLNEAIERELQWKDSFRFDRGDGTYGHAVSHALIIRDSSSRAVRVIGAMQDMTERTLAEEKIRQLSHQNALILEYAAEGIYAMSRDGKLITVNPATAKMTGFSLDELRAASNIHDLIHHSRADGSPYPFDECPKKLTMDDGIARTSEDLFWKKSGEPFTVDYSCSPIYENNDIAGCVMIFQDITERRRLEKQIEQAHRVNSLGRVAATIAHEFNNVLMGIQPFAEVIRRNGAADEKMQKAANQIIGSVARGKRIAQEILRFSQPSQPAIQPVVLAAWLEQLLPELRAMIGERLTIDMDQPSRPVVAGCDPTLLQQVVSNLVLNARDAMPGGGLISLITADSCDERQFSFGRIPAGMVLLAVRDYGSGMPPEVQRSIFDPLFTTKRSGTGLGLAVAKQIIEVHGGSIHVDTAPGKGTTFFLLLPAAEMSERF